VSLILTCLMRPTADGGLTCPLLRPRTWAPPFAASSHLTGGSASGSEQEAGVSCVEVSLMGCESGGSPSTFGPLNSEAPMISRTWDRRMRPVPSQKRGRITTGRRKPNGRRSGISEPRSPSGPCRAGGPALGSGPCLGVSFPGNPSTVRHGESGNGVLPAVGLTVVAAKRVLMPKRSAVLGAIAALKNALHTVNPYACASSAIPDQCRGGPACLNQPWLF
jgi:hypothetical protein